jgi:hypothetical protein
VFTPQYSDRMTKKTMGKKTRKKKEEKSTQNQQKQDRGPDAGGESRYKFTH